MRGVCVAAAALVVGLLAAVAAEAQEGAVAFQRIDLLGLPTVSLYFTVADSVGGALLGVRADELALTLDGVPQQITLLRSALEGGEHLAIAMLFDRSGSMKTGIDAARDAGMDFLDRLSLGDELAIVSFDTEVRVETDLTSDRARITTALAGIDKGSDTALYDAILVGLESLATATTPRQAVVVLTDGKDTRSHSTYEAVVDRAVAQGVPVYAIGLPVKSDQAVLERMAAETGGAYLRADAPGDLRALYQLIAEQLANQYFLQFEASSGIDENWHDMRLAYTASAAAAPSASRQFVASTGPGISRSRMNELSSGVARRDLVTTAWAGGFGGLLLGLALLILVKLTRPDVSAASLPALALVIVSILLGAVLGPLAALLGVWS